MLNSKQDLQVSGMHGLFLVRVLCVKQPTTAIQIYSSFPSIANFTPIFKDQAKLTALRHYSA